MTLRMMWIAAGAPRAVAAVIVGGLLTGCGLTAQDQPRPLPSLIGSPTPPPSAPATGQQTAITVALVRGTRLEAVPRRVPAGAGPLEAVRAVLGGPDPAETARGLRSALPVDAKILRVERQADTIILEFDGALTRATGREQVLAIAQLVYAATATSGSPEPSERVLLRVTGRPIPLPLANGSLTEQPVSRRDYSELGP